MVTPAYSSISPRGCPAFGSPFRNKRNSLCLLRVHAGQLTTFPVIMPRVVVVNVKLADSKRRNKFRNIVVVLIVFVDGS